MSPESETQTPRTEQIIAAVKAALANANDTGKLQYWLDRANQWTLDEVIVLIRFLAESPRPANDDGQRVVDDLASRITGRMREIAPVSNRDDSATLTQVLVECYRNLPVDARLRNHILAWLARLGSADRFERVADLLACDPPLDREFLPIVFDPLMQLSAESIPDIFPRLLAAFQYSQLAAAVLELANYYYRAGLVARHPANSRLNEILPMLMELTKRLNRIESGELPPGKTSQQIAEMVGQSIELAVASCDALGLIGDRAAIDVLRTIALLKHRRIRTEAAAALARLGDAEGTDQLLGLAAEPIARLRVLTYAHELGIQSRIPDSFRSPAAEGESALAIWLAEPERFGIAPLRLELADQRPLFWPGYEEPQLGLLFRFYYPQDSAEYCNIGIARPCTHAIEQSLLELSLIDIFALFAGWQAQHEDIFELDASRLTGSMQQEQQSRASRLEQAEFEDLEPIFVGRFFDEMHSIWGAKNKSQAGILACDDRAVMWVPEDSVSPWPPGLIYNLFKGRKLLAAFNPELEFPDPIEY